MSDRPFFSHFSTNMKVSKIHTTPSDRVFVDFCRCLYQAKAVVRDLESFSNSVCPALSQYPKLLKDKKEITRFGNGLLLKQVNQYLNTTFRKFTRLCKILMIVLTQMEVNSIGQIKRERIDSFRFEVWEEWKTATSIKQRLISFTQQSENTVYTTTTTTTTNSDSSTTDSSISATCSTTCSTTLP